MAQVKKDAVRGSILAAALRLFRKQGYMGTTLNAIAAAAKTSRANIYVYFPSKFAIFYAAFEPWLDQQLTVLEHELARIANPRARLRRILLALWREIPTDGKGFANNLMQALSTAARDEPYSPAVLHKVEARVAAMIEACLPPGTAVDSRSIAHLAFMAFDGFAMHAHLATGEACSDALIDSMCALLFLDHQKLRLRRLG